jgi:hypothetical protein
VEIAAERGLGVTGDDIYAFLFMADLPRLAGVMVACGAGCNEIVAVVILGRLPHLKAPVTIQKLDHNNHNCTKIALKVNTDYESPPSRAMHYGKLCIAITPLILMLTSS